MLCLSKMSHALCCGQEPETTHYKEVYTNTLGSTIEPTANSETNQRCGNQLHCTKRASGTRSWHHGKCINPTNHEQATNNKFLYAAGCTNSSRVSINSTDSPGASFNR